MYSKVLMSLLLLYSILLVSCSYNYEKKSLQQGVSKQNSSATKSSDMTESSSSNRSAYLNIIGSKCVGCHSAANPQGGASFDSIKDIRRWRERIRYRALDRKDMPPQSQLPRSEAEILGQWIDQGAPDIESSDDWPLNETPNFEEIKSRIFSKSCFQCHSGANPEMDLDLENYEQARNKKDLILKRTVIDKDMPMAPFEELTKNEKKLLSHWIIDGAPL